MHKLDTYKSNNLFFHVAIILFFSCNSTKKTTLEYVDNYKVKSNFYFNGSRVGGISGIDFNEKNNHFFLISDDRSKHDNARFYSLKINILKNKIDTVQFLKKIIIADKNADFYKKDEVDFESIRFNPIKNKIIIGDEGGKKGKASIKILNLDGIFQQNFPLKKEYLSKIRNNKAFESISFSKDYKSIFYATEAPLINDGNIASIQNKGFIRIFESNFINGEITNEFLYWLEKVPQKAAVKPPWKGAGSDNGLSEILVLNENTFLTIERSGAYQKNGSFNYISKVFLVEKGEINSDKTFKTNKKELVNFSKLTFGKANIEGMTLGPIINQKQTILFVSDNNFNDKIPTIIYLFTISYK